MSVKRSLRGLHNCFLGSQNRPGISHHTGIYMHSNNDILDVVDAQSSAGVLGSSRDRDPSNADGGPRNALHQQWNRDSLLGRSYRDVRDVVNANTLPSYAALASIPSSHSRDNTLSREIHHFTVSLKYRIPCFSIFSFSHRKI